MFPRVINAKSISNYIIEIEFSNNEKKLFDASPYIDLGVFKEFKNKEYFSSVKVENGTTVWKNGQDFCPDMLYIEGKSINENKKAAV